MTTTPTAGADPELTAVIPVYNEVGSLPQMHKELTAGLAQTGRTYEVIYINDGSSDGTSDLLDKIASENPGVVGVVHFRRNFGKSPALNAGFDLARGAIVLTLDADLQDDPAMIPQFVERIEAGADLVSGWKQRRHDPIGKTAPSKIFNAVVRKVSGVQLRDFNCGYKAYRRECIEELSVYGGFHRFLPVLAGHRGFRVEELVVNHRAREHGASKYGVKRFFDGILDLLTVLMVTRYRTRPVHFFGLLGMVSGVFGVGTLLYLTILWLMGHPIGDRPLLELGALLTLTAVQLIGIGLVGELLVRTTITSSEVFSVRHTSGFLSRPSVLSPSLPPLDRPSPPVADPAPAAAVSPAQSPASP